MTDSIEVKNCNDDDIISFNDEICKIKKIREATKDYFFSHSNKYINYRCEKLNINISIFEIIETVTVNGKICTRKFTQNLFSNGKECQILKEGKRWQTGKLRVKLTLEFCPDEPEVIENNAYQDVDGIAESPLDEIRQQLTYEN